jgi:ABC-type uncharacterized transport system fused permease/ATPase subunit
MQIDPNLIILDDAASKLGSDEEARLYEMFLSERRNATMVVVCQRLGRLLSKADQILYVSLALT